MGSALTRHRNLGSAPPCARAPAILSVTSCPSPLRPWLPGKTLPSLASHLYSRNQSDLSPRMPCLGSFVTSSAAWISEITQYPRPPPSSAQSPQTSAPARCLVGLQTPEPRLASRSLLWASVSPSFQRVQPRRLRLLLACDPRKPRCQEGAKQLTSVLAVHPQSGRRSNGDVSLGSPNCEHWSQNLEPPNLGTLELPNVHMGTWCVVLGCWLSAIGLSQKLSVDKPHYPLGSARHTPGPHGPPPACPHTGIPLTPSAHPKLLKQQCSSGPPHSNGHLEVSERD